MVKKIVGGGGGGGSGGGDKVEAGVKIKREWIRTKEKRSKKKRILFLQFIIVLRIFLGVRRSRLMAGGL